MANEVPTNPLSALKAKQHRKLPWIPWQPRFHKDTSEKTITKEAYEAQRLHNEFMRK